MHQPDFNFDFVYQDFVLVKGERAAVQAALEKAIRQEDTVLNDIVLEPYRPGIFMRLFMWIFGIKIPKNPDDPEELMKMMTARMSDEEKAKHEADMADMQALHEEEAAGLPENEYGTAPYNRREETGALRPIAWERHGKTGHIPESEFYAPGGDDMRLSSIEGGWVLLEYRNFITGGCTQSGMLSEQLDDADVLYFRFSGPKAEEMHYDFHVYQNFSPVHRVLCHETWPRTGPKRTRNPDDSWWEGILDGEDTRYEPAGLYEGATQQTLLDNAKLEAILRHNGLSWAALFGPGARHAPVRYSRQPGGVEIGGAVT